MISIRIKTSLRDAKKIMNFHYKDLSVETGNKDIIYFITHSIVGGLEIGNYKDGILTVHKW